MRFRVAGRRRRAEGPFRGAGEAAARPAPPPARYGRGGDRKASWEPGAVAAARSVGRRTGLRPGRPPACERR